MRKQLRNLFLSTVAATALCTGQAQADSTTFFDGYEFWAQFGPTPDQFQSQVGFLDGDVVYSDSQIYSAILATTLQDFLIHQDPDGNPIEVSYMTLVESSFPGTNTNALWIVLHDGGSGPNGWVDIEVFMCSDSNCTNWLWAETHSLYDGTAGAFPIEGSVHNLQIIINPMVGAVSYRVDGIPGTAGEGLVDMNIIEFSGGFEEPIAGVFWAVGCDGSYWDWSQIWASCYRGLMDQVFLYSGPFPVYDSPELAHSFYDTSGFLMIAKELGTGIGVFGTMPTIYLHHDPAEFTNNNARWFEAIDPSPVLPAYIENIYDPYGNTGSLQWDSRWPY